MKKITSLILAVILLLSAVSCSNRTDNPEATSAPDTSGAITSVPATEEPCETEPPAPVYPIIPATPTVEEARQIVLDYMIKMSSIKWTCPVEIDFSKEKSYTSTLYYHAGQSYVGLPYVSHHSGWRYFELNFLDDNRNYTGPTAYADMPGVTCAISCYASFRNVSFRTRGSGTGTITPAGNSGMVKVGDYVCKSTNTKEVIEANTAQAIYEAYALLEVGDVVTERQSTGHSRMVYSKPVVKRTPDGKISPSASRLYVIEQCSSFNPDVKDYNTTWRVNKMYTFQQLYDKYYIPSRLAEFDTELDDARVTVTGLTTADTLKGKTLSGKVVSNFVILNSLVTITDSDGNVVSVSEQAKDYPNSATSYAIDFAEKGLSVSIDDLPAGTYRFKASVFIGYGECILGEFTFTK